MNKSSVINENKIKQKYISTKIPAGKLGVPGICGYLIFVEAAEEEEKKGMCEMNTDTSLREFIVRGALGKRPYFEDTISASIDKNTGHSFLKITDIPNVQNIPNLTFNKMKLETSFGIFDFDTNDNSELSIIEFRCHANSDNEAMTLFHKGVHPFIDYISYLTNVPIYLNKTICEDKINKSIRANYITPYTYISFNSHIGKIHNELIPVYALYREAKNSTSNYYKFLCYYKILEGIFRSIRPLLNKEAHSKNITIRKKAEKFPEHPELVKFHKNYIGKAIGDVFGKEFTKEYRDALSHFKIDGSSPLILSEYLFSSKVSNAIFPIEIASRIVIENQVDYFEQVRGN